MFVGESERAVWQRVILTGEFGRRLVSSVWTICRDAAGAVAMPTDQLSRNLSRTYTHIPATPTCANFLSPTPFFYYYYYFLLTIFIFIFWFIFSLSVRAFTSEKVQLANFLYFMLYTCAAVCFISLLCEIYSVLGRIFRS